MALEELQVIERHIEQLDREAMGLLGKHQQVVHRVAEVPGFGVDSALQMIAEVGPKGRYSARRRGCPRGWGCVQGTKRAQASRTAHARRRATGKCGGC